MADGARLTDLAHRQVAAVAGMGDEVVDATAGNGHDTLELARLVGETGRVYAFDIQQAAIDQTRRRLSRHGLLERVTLQLCGHEHLLERLAPESQGKIAAVMFNLGYLPGGDKQRVTRAATTVPAMEQAARCLRPGGILTVIAYPGHPGGSDELDAVTDWFENQSHTLEAVQIVAPGGSAPVLLSARRGASRA
jgi:ubiquinone/menaquinone biosynthesis C-methylase UbiE